MLNDFSGLCLLASRTHGRLEVGLENPNDPQIPGPNLLQLGGEGAVKPFVSPAPVFAASSGADNTGAVDVAKPAGTVEGDLLIAFGMVFDNLSATIAAPLGWSLISGPNPNSGTAAGMVTYAWRKIAGASEPASYQFTPSPTQYTYVFALRFTGHDPIDPIDVDVKANAAFSATRAGLSINTTRKNSLLILTSAGEGSFANTPPTGMTQIATVANVRSVYAETIAAAGATGDRTQANDVSDGWVTQMFAISGQNPVQSFAQAVAAG